MDKNITYILGAGASCYSQPLVSDMKERMECLLYLLDSKNGASDNFIFKSETEHLYNKYKPIVSEANQHFTVDTYAKKLFLTEQVDKLNTLKEFLNLYFLYEQDDLYNVYDPPFSTNDEVREKIFTFKDYRYDVFFATLLQNNNSFGSNKKLKLPQNKNIISWNYDNQFEISYREYAGNQNFSEIYDTLLINKEYKDDASNIVKLNGYCNIYNIDTKDQITFKDQLETLIAGYDSISNNINFAWEERTRNFGTINSIMNKTEILIIIGYSFPNFNRSVDKDIFEKSSSQLSSKRNSILIQVPEYDEFIKIKERIQTIKEFDDSCFKHIKDADQFYIPL